MELRPYQEEGVRACLDSLPRNPILSIGTGGGKSLIGAEVTRRHGTRTLWLAHRFELLQQARRTLLERGLSVGFIRSKWPESPSAQVQVASVDTLRRRVAVPDIGLVVLDEAHRAMNRTNRKILGWYPGTPRLGMTATPQRTDGKPLGEVFGLIVCPRTNAELCADGFLVEPTVFVPEIPNLKGVHLRGGDFASDELEARMNTVRLVGNIVRTYLGKCAGRRFVVFAVSVAHSKAIAEAFRSAGVPVEHLDGDTPEGDRQRILSDLAAGRLLGVSQVNIMIEGIDIPSLEVCVMARPTASIIVHRQALGRVMRCCEGKFGAVVLDHAANALRLGSVTDPVEWDLESRIKPVKDGKKGKVCKRCSLLVKYGVRECPSCGYIFPAPKGREVEEVDGELVPLSAARSAAPFEERRAFWDEVWAECQRRGHKEGWAAHRYLARFGAWPVAVDGSLVDPASPSEDAEKKVYKRFAKDVLVKGYKVGYAAKRFQAVFGKWPPWAWSKQLEALAEKRKAVTA